MVKVKAVPSVASAAVPLRARTPVSRASCLTSAGKSGVLSGTEAIEYESSNVPGIPKPARYRERARSNAF
jgi:hypothetical protein